MSEAPLPNIPTNGDGVDMVQFAQQIRLDIVNAMTMNGNQVPTVPDDVKLLLNVLKDSDHSEISRAKIKADQRGGEEDRKTALLLAEMAIQRAQRNNNRNPFEAATIDVTVSIPAPNVNELPPVNPTSGQTQRGHQIEGYDQFIARTGGSGGA